jgi:Holliday junction resolvasome RuvABC endonuclease subunit
MSIVKVGGLDLSMTGTGAAHTVEGAACTHLIKTRERGDLRLNEIAGQVKMRVTDSDLVIIEGYLNHSHSAGITGMVHGAVRAMLIEEGIKYATLPPSSLKKYATGRGGASKTDMALAAFKRGGVEFTDDNQCDAWWLWVAANDYLDQPVFSLPAIQRAALMDALKMEV